MQYDSAYIELL